MNAALEQMLSLRQATDNELTTLKNSGFSHPNLGKATGTLRNYGFTKPIEPRYESATELP
jgi:hypothetical protein